MPRKYGDQFKAKAIGLAEERIKLEGCSIWAAADEVGEKLDISTQTLDTWLKRQPSRARSNTPSESAEDATKCLRQENKELHGANEILKTASAFFAAELDRLARRCSTTSVPIVLASGSRPSAASWVQQNVGLSPHADTAPRKHARHQCERCRTAC